LAEETTTVVMKNELDVAPAGTVTLA